jgi:hypothetical protein
MTFQLHVSQVPVSMAYCAAMQIGTHSSADEMMPFRMQILIVDKFWLVRAMMPGSVPNGYGK